MKINKTIIKIISILSLAVILLLWPILILSNNSEIWFLLQKDNTVLSKGEIKMYDQSIISFFNGDENNLDFLKFEEISHLQNVRSLLIKTDLTFWLSLNSFSLSILYLRKSAKNILRVIPILVISFLSLLLMLSILSFNSLFLRFHETFFTENYSFPSDSMLKILFPDSFFKDIFIFYFILSVLGCLIGMIVSYRLKVKKL